MLSEVIPRSSVSHVTCFSTRAPSYLYIAFDLAEIAKYLALPVVGSALLKLVTKGKDIKEGVEAWVALPGLLVSKRRAELEILSQALANKEGQPVTLRVALSQELASGRQTCIWFDDPSSPGDALVTMAILGQSVERAIAHIEKRGATIAHELTVKVRPQHFEMSWHDSCPSTDFVAVFTLDGRQIGEWIREELPDDEKAAAVRGIIRSVDMFENE